MIRLMPTKFSSMKLKLIKTKKIIYRPWNGWRRYLMQKKEQKKEMSWKFSVS
jgi:hypothetical protein